MLNRSMESYGKPDNMYITVSADRETVTFGDGQMEIEWKTPEKIPFADSLTGETLELDAVGMMIVEVADSHLLYTKLSETIKDISEAEEKTLAAEIRSYCKSLVFGTVSANLSAIIQNEAIDLLEIDSKLYVISPILQRKIANSAKEYGLTVLQFYVTDVALPKDHPNYRHICELHALAILDRGDRPLQ